MKYSNWKKPASLWCFCMKPINQCKIPEAFTLSPLLLDFSFFLSFLYPRWAFEPEPSPRVSLPAIHWQPHPQSFALAFAESRMYCLTDRPNCFLNRAANIGWVITGGKGDTCWGYSAVKHSWGAFSSSHRSDDEKHIGSPGASINAHLPDSVWGCRSFSFLPPFQSLFFPMAGSGKVPRIWPPFSPARCPPESGAIAISPPLYSHMWTPPQLWMLQ